MRIIVLILMVAFFNSFASCKSTKETEKYKTTTFSEDSSLSTAKQKEQIFRLSVSFYSIGAGTDATAIDKFNNMLKSYSPQLKYELSRWGREGEINYCFQLKELNPNKQNTFINEVKKLLNDCQLVHIEENTTCIKR